MSWLAKHKEKCIDNVLGWLFGAISVSGIVSALAIVDGYSPVFVFTLTIFLFGCGVWITNHLGAIRERQDRLKLRDTWAELHVTTNPVGLHSPNGSNIADVHSTWAITSEGKRFVDVVLIFKHPVANLHGVSVQGVNSGVPRYTARNCTERYASLLIFPEPPNSYTIRVSINGSN